MNLFTQRNLYWGKTRKNDFKILCGKYLVRILFFSPLLVQYLAFCLQYIFFYITMHLHNKFLFILYKLCMLNKNTNV